MASGTEPDIWEPLVGGAKTKIESRELIMITLVFDGSAAAWAEDFPSKYLIDIDAPPETLIANQQWAPTIYYLHPDMTIDEMPTYDTWLNGLMKASE